MGLDVQPAGGEDKLGVGVFPPHLALISSWGLRASQKIPMEWAGYCNNAARTISQGGTVVSFPSPSSPSHSRGLFASIRQF